MSAPAQQSAPAVANPGDTKPIYANSWTLEPPRPAAGTASPDYVLGVLCEGTFEGPSKSNSSVFTSTFIQCSEPAAISARTALDKCVRVGGPDDFSCTTVKRSAGSTTGNSFYLNVPVYYSPCKTGEYRPRAYYQYVNGEEYPDVVGNIVNVQC